jgi:hypothetical protein
MSSCLITHASLPFNNLVLLITNRPSELNAGFTWCDIPPERPLRR